jgi:LPS export ABC transporter protein LptC
MERVQSLIFNVQCSALWLISLLFFSCENEIDKVQSSTQEIKFPTATYRDYDALYSDSAIVRIRITGKIMEQYSEGIAHDEFKEGVHIWFYDTDRKVESELTANAATRQRLNNVMVAKGNVVVYNKKGDKLNTEHLTWDGKSRKVYTDAFVRITTPDKVMTGTGLESDETFSKYKILNVKGIIRR